MGCFGGGWHPPASGARLWGLCRSARMDVLVGIEHHHGVEGAEFGLWGPLRVMGESEKGWVLSWGSLLGCSVGTGCVLP